MAQYGAATAAPCGNKFTITLLTLRRASQEFRALHATITLLALRNTERKSKPAVSFGLGYKELTEYQIWKSKYRSE